MTYYTTYDSPLGTMVLAATDAGLAGVWFEAQRHFKGVQDGWQRDDAHVVLKRAAAQLDEYFTGQRRDFDLPLDAQGTAFQRAVWDALCAIPFGAASSYGEQARALGKPRALRAVGAAIGRNPFSIVVPCHRVLGADRALTGYAGGLERKRALLALEGVLQA